VLVRQVAPGVDCAVSEMVRVSSPCSMIAPCHLTTDRQHRAEQRGAARRLKQADDDPPAGERISVRDSAEGGSEGRGREEDQEAVWLGYLIMDN
jgi:hypothetical protein